MCVCVCLEQQQGDQDTRDLLQLGVQTQRVEFKVYRPVSAEHTRGATHLCTHAASDLNVDLVGLTELAGATPLFGSFICLLRAPHCV